jgi:NADPH-dependent FMN reductase
MSMGSQLTTPIRILGIAGSLRRESYNRAALRAATELAPKDASVETFELDGIPSFNQDEEQNPPGQSHGVEKTDTRGECYSVCYAGIQLRCIEKCN